MLCRHCERRSVCRPRGLCWNCYYRPGVRDLYPSTSKFGYRGLGYGNGPALLPPFPTSASPGTPEKIAILQQRARQHMELFHPDDALSDEMLIPARAG